MGVTFSCVEAQCGFSSAVLWLYLRHYKQHHTKHTKHTQHTGDATQLCPCGSSNACDALFCVECGWDLRIKPIEAVMNRCEKDAVCVSVSELSGMSADALLNTDGKAMVIHTAPPQKPEFVSDYWSCADCSFSNHKSSSRCLVCAMVGSVPVPVATSAVSIPKTTASTSKDTKRKPSKPMSVRKKNAFGWICSACTFENKPATQRCAMCNDPKPKKKKKKKKKTKTKPSESYQTDPHYADDDLEAELASYAQTAQSEKPWEKYEKRNGKDRIVCLNGNGNLKWGAAGNEKCHCGSGKKYKKCCKKRDRMRVDNGSMNGHSGHRGASESAVAEIEAVIERAEREIAQFRGKKGDKMRLHRELEKAKKQRNALWKMANEKQRDIEQEQRVTAARGSHARSNGNSNGVAPPRRNAAASRVIAI